MSDSGLRAAKRERLALTDPNPLTKFFPPPPGLLTSLTGYLTGWLKKDSTFMGVLTGSRVFTPKWWGAGRDLTNWHSCAIQ